VTLPCNDSTSHPHRPARLLQALCVLAICSPPVWAQANEACGALNITSIGPYDYRTDKKSMKVVEDHHFTPEIEALMRGGSGGLGGDLSYTLRSIPNHHRALIAVAKYGERPKHANLQFSVECYFDRAVRFQPDDTVVRALYAQYLHRKKRSSEAMTQLDAAAQYAKDNGFSHFNIGLMYFELGQFDRAVSQAQRARELGFERTELEDLLKQANKWPAIENLQVPKN